MNGPLDGRLYWFRARALRSVDGDTLDVQLDLGFGRQTFRPEDPTRPHPLATRIRLEGIDTWEKKRPTLADGKAAQVVLDDWILHANSTWAEDSWPLIIHTGRDHHLDRWIGTVYARSSGEDVADYLRLHGAEKRE